MFEVTNCDLKAHNGGNLVAVVLGSSDDAALRELSEYGADMVIIGENAALSSYSARTYAQAMTALAKKYEPEIFIIPATGFVPEDHIVGKPLFIWISLDPDYGLFDGKMRWSRFFKWVQVHDNQVDARDIILCHLLLVILEGTATQYSSEDFGMQSLNSAAQYAGVGGDIFHAGTGYAQLFDELLRSACAEQFYTLRMEGAQYFFQSVLVENGYQCTLDFPCFCHLVSLFFCSVNSVLY